MDVILFFRRIEIPHDVVINIFLIYIVFANREQAAQNHVFTDIKEFIFQFNNINHMKTTYLGREKEIYLKRLEISVKNCIVSHTVQFLKNISLK